MTQMVAIDTRRDPRLLARDKDKMQEDLEEISPDAFPGRAADLREDLQGGRRKRRGRDQGKIFAKAVRWAARCACSSAQGESPGPMLKAEYELADKQMFSKVRDCFGGNLELAMTGAAPVAKEMLEFFDACGVLCWRATA